MRMCEILVITSLKVKTHLDDLLVFLFDWLRFSNFSD